MFSLLLRMVTAHSRLEAYLFRSRTMTQAGVVVRALDLAPPVRLERR